MLGRGTIVVACALAAVAYCGAGATAQEVSTPARPFIALEKTRFAVNEQIFFWEGVSAPNGYRIPRELWDTCKLTITRPDGTQRADTVGWPRDGMIDGGWQGGHGLGAELPQVGTYTLVFEFAGIKTAPATFVVEDVAVTKGITGEFIYPSPLDLRSDKAVVTLVIRNGSDQLIQFPHRGVMYQHVSGGLEKTSGEKWGSSFFVPADVLLDAAKIKGSTIANDRFTWDMVGRVPTVSLPPGVSYRLDLPLAGILSTSSRRMPPGEYDLRLSTNVQILIGAADGPFASLAPFRLAITSSARGIR